MENFNFITADDRALIYNKIPAKDKRLSILLCLDSGWNPGRIARCFQTSRQNVWLIKKQYIKEGIDSFIR